MFADIRQLQKLPPAPPKGPPDGPPHKKGPPEAVSTYSDMYDLPLANRIAGDAVTG